MKNNFFVIIILGLIVSGCKSTTSYYMEDSNYSSGKFKSDGKQKTSSGLTIYEGQKKKEQTVRKQPRRPLSIFLDLNDTTLTPEEFDKVAKYALASRGWKIISTDNSNEHIGMLIRKDITYKVSIRNKGDLILIQYVSGYGGRKVNYLRNLKHDISSQLGLGG